MSDFKTKEEKLAILSMAARYDASCSSSGSSRGNKNGGLGNAQASGVCHSWSDDGRCISLLKILLSNNCMHDCAYCVNRRSNDIPRASFTSEEVADITIEFYKRNYIEGLFLSSAVYRSADYSMELMIRAVRHVRERGFNGYIHLKVMPGGDPRLIQEAGLLADRISANIEFPTSKGLELLAPDKNPALVLGSIKNISHRIREYGDSKIYLPRSTPQFASAGQSTQLIVGATDDSDKTILNLSESLYKKLSLKRVYYSAFVPVSSDSRLPALLKPPLKREHRLYQADWLLRFYGFSASEILDEKHPHLAENLDPKTAWALRNYSFFPVEINKASYMEILRVPGIGVVSAQRILKSRRQMKLGFPELKRLGVVLKRAQFFITCNGLMMHKTMYPESIAEVLSDEPGLIKQKELIAGQLSLFGTRLLA
jgi:putative DNA modification/repair radical SAM protein